MVMVSRRWYALIGLLVIAVLASGNPARAQDGSARIEGRVFDSQQLAIPDAVVELLDTKGNSIQKVIGDATGHYRLDSVAAGTYTVQFGRSGFETKKAPVSISDGQTVVLDAALQPQSVAQTITVLGSADDRQVASKTDIPAQVLPATVNTVPLELIQQQNSTGVIPVINNVPGANAVTQYGSLNYFIFRGF